MRKYAVRHGAVLLWFAMLVVACGGDPAGPSMAEVAGSYQATRFTTITGGVSTDELAAGAEIALELETDGAAFGVLFVPQGDEGGGDLDLSLDGTWRLSGNTVTLESTADAFLGDVPLTVVGETLVGDRMFFGTFIQMTLTRR